MSVSGASAPTFGDLFADVLNQRHDPGSDGAPERGADLHQSLSLPFEDAMRGAQRQLDADETGHVSRLPGDGPAAGG